MFTRAHLVASALQRLIVPNAPGQLDIQLQVGSELSDDLSVVAAPESRVQIHQVDPLRARVLPALSCDPRITEPLFRASAALHQLHRLSPSEVDRR